MRYREATNGDISEIQRIRNSVKENVLSDPTSVTDEACREYLSVRGKGWVCESHDGIVGFAIADLMDDNIWALFLNPEFEGKGIGRKLHNLMLDWYFSTGKERVWLGTSPNTRAAVFYRKMGWTETGVHGDDEIRFEMSREDWMKHR